MINSAVGVTGGSLCILTANHGAQGGRGGGGVLGLIFAGYAPLASQSPYTIMVYSVVNYRPHLSHFKYVIFAIPAKSLSTYVSTLY